MTALPQNLPQGFYDLQGEMQERVTPTKPHRVCALVQAKLPSASDWSSCVVWVSDTKVLVVSDGENWIRTDTGVAI